MNPHPLTVGIEVDGKSLSWGRKSCTALSVSKGYSWDIGVRGETGLEWEKLRGKQSL